MLKFPLPRQNKGKKTPSKSHREVLSSSSSIPSIPSQDQSSIPPLQIVFHTATGAISSSTQSPSNPTTTPSPTYIPAMAQNPPRPWKNPGVVRMASPLHQLPTYPEKWLPKFNPDNGLLAKEHINNFMFSFNLNQVEEEDAFVILFPYTLQGAARSWYFSLPLGSINSWDSFQEKFLTKFGHDRSTTTLINDLSNLKAEPR